MPDRILGEAGRQTRKERDEILRTLLSKYFGEGDAGALAAFFAAFYDDANFDALKAYVRKHGGPASTQTLEEVRQIVLHEYYARIVSGKSCDVLQDPFGLIVNMGCWRLKDLRSRKRPGYAPTEVRALVFDPGPTPTQAIRLSEMEENFAKALDALSPQDREWIEKHLDGKTYQEMADELGKPVNQVRSYSSRARKRLAEILRGMDTTFERLLDSEKPSGGARPPVSWPSISEIRAEVEKLTPTVGAAMEVIRLLHLEGQPLSFEQVSETIGEKAARTRRRKGYEILSFRMKVPFPKAFEEASK